MLDEENSNLNRVADVVEWTRLLECYLALEEVSHREMV